MFTLRRLALLALAAGAALTFSGCGASHQARSMEIKDSLLINPAILEKGADGQALYRYENPKANFKSYSKVMIDSVLMSKSTDIDASDTENYQKLVNNAFVFLNDELKKDYAIVQAPEPGTLKIQMAIIAADSAKPVRNLLGTIFPMGGAVSAVKYSATGKPWAVGEITVGVKITDAVTGELLGAAVDRRVGGMNIKGTWDTWMTADDALKFWAKKAAFVLCEKRGVTACVKPE